MQLTTLLKVLKILKKSKKINLRSIQYLTIELKIN